MYSSKVLRRPFLLLASSLVWSGCTILFDGPPPSVLSSDGGGENDGDITVSPDAGSTLHLHGNLLELSFSNGLTTDSSGNARTVSPTGDATLEAGYFGQGIRFDNSPTKSLLTVSHAPDMSNLEGLTVEAWVKFETSEQLGPIFGNLNSAANDPVEHAVGISTSGKPTYRTRDGDSSSFRFVECSVALPVGDWAHVAVTVAYPTVSFYINAELINADASFAMPPAATTRDYSIGSFPGSGQFVGVMDEIKVSDYAKTLPQIEASMIFDPGP